MFHYKIIHQDKKTKARTGEIATPHGVIQTPAFVPVGTLASIKSFTDEPVVQCSHGSGGYSCKTFRKNSVAPNITIIRSDMEDIPPGKTSFSSSKKRREKTHSFL
jgi:hypothetical protein